MVSWRTVRIIPFRRTGNWIIGAALQEDETGKRRVKIFKGRIKENGTHSVVYKGKELRFSMTQRLNISSKRYWRWLKTQVDAIVNAYLEEGEAEEGDEEVAQTILDWLGELQEKNA